jgi:hypothetical protein
MANWSTPLTGLYSDVYSVPAEAVTATARDRAHAMLHSDRWAAEGCDPGSPLIAEERTALVSSYERLLAAGRR